MRIFSPELVTLPMGTVNLSNFTATHNMAYGLPFSSTVAASSQDFPLPPAIADVEDKNTFIPFANGSGQVLTVGSVVCWKIDPLRRRWAETANYWNRYDPAGVVVFGSVPEGGNGWLAQAGRVINAKVLGEATLAAGTVLDVVPGQIYLQGTTSVLVGGARWHFRILENHFTAAVQLKRVRVDCTI